MSSTAVQSNSTSESSESTTVSPLDQHSPVILPVWAQIVILHLIAGIFALFFYFLREYVISQLNQKAVEKPNRMSNRRKPNSSS